MDDRSGVGRKGDGGNRVTKLGLYLGSIQSVTSE